MDGMDPSFDDLKSKVDDLNNQMPDTTEMEEQAYRTLDATGRFKRGERLPEETNWSGNYSQSNKFEPTENTENDGTSSFGVNTTNQPSAQDEQKAEYENVSRGLRVRVDRSGKVTFENEGKQGWSLFSNKNSRQMDALNDFRENIDYSNNLDDTAKANFDNTLRTTAENTRKSFWGRFFHGNKADEIVKNLNNSAEERQNYGLNRKSSQSAESALETPEEAQQRSDYEEWNRNNSTIDSEIAEERRRANEEATRRFNARQTEQAQRGFQRRFGDNSNWRMIK